VISYELGENGLMCFSIFFGLIGKMANDMILFNCLLRNVVSVFEGHRVFVNDCVQVDGLLRVLVQHKINMIASKH